LYRTCGRHEKKSSFVAAAFVFVTYIFVTKRKMRGIGGEKQTFSILLKLSILLSRCLSMAVA